MMYTVIRAANMSDPTSPHYKHCFKAYADGKWAGEISDTVAAVPLHDSYKIIIQEEPVFADSALHAIDKFRTWLHNGLDRSYLLA